MRIKQSFELLGNFFSRSKLKLSILKGYFNKNTDDISLVLRKICLFWMNALRFRIFIEFTNSKLKNNF